MCKNREIQNFQSQVILLLGFRERRFLMLKNIEITFEY